MTRRDLAAINLRRAFLSIAANRPTVRPDPLEFLTLPRHQHDAAQLVSTMYRPRISAIRDYARAICHAIATVRFMRRVERERDRWLKIPENRFRTMLYRAERARARNSPNGRKIQAIADGIERIALEGRP